MRIQSPTCEARRSLFFFKEFRERRVGETFLSATLMNYDEGGTAISREIQSPWKNRLTRS